MQIVIQLLYFLFITVSYHKLLLINRISILLYLKAWSTHILISPVKFTDEEGYILSHVFNQDMFAKHLLCVLRGARTTVT